MLVGMASIVVCNSDDTGMATSTFVFCVLIVMVPSRTCWRPSLTASDRRKPVFNRISSARRARVPSAWRARYCATCSSPQRESRRCAA